MAISPLSPTQVEANRLAAGGAPVQPDPPQPPPYPLPGTWLAANAGSTGQLSPPQCRVQGGAFSPFAQ